MGVEGLRKARSHLAGAKKVVIHTTGKEDLSGRRLLVAVDFVHEDGSSTCNGEALLSLAFLSTGGGLCPQLLPSCGCIGAVTTSWHLSYLQWSSSIPASPMESMPVPSNLS